MLGTKTSVMQKEHYKKELSITNKAGIVKIGSKGKEVLKVQQLNNLWVDMKVGLHKTLALDGEFGPGTKDAVEDFQRKYGLLADGEVGPKTMMRLSSQIRHAFTSFIDPKEAIRTSVLRACHLHLESYPRELKQNEGPWVRSYCSGKDGKNYAWCMGFAQTMYDQALSAHGKKFTEHMPNSLSCDKVAVHFKNKGQLYKNAAMRKMSATDLLKVVKPGDLFLTAKNSKDWIHTGIIEKVDGHLIHTIEGNTNDEGSREGYEVCRRVRDLKKQNIDIAVLKL